MTAFSNQQKTVIRKNMLADAKNLVEDLEMKIQTGTNNDDEHIAYIARRLNASSEELLRE